MTERLFQRHRAPRRAARPRPARASGLLAWAAVLFAAWPPAAAEAQSAAAEAQSAAAEAQSADAAIAIEARLEIEGPPALGEGLRAASVILSAGDPRTPTIAALRRQARADLNRMGRFLRAEGYYDNRLDFTLDAAASPPRIVFRARTGPRFTIRDYVIRYTDDVDGRPRSIEALGLDLRRSPRGADIAAAERAILRALRSQGFPAARAVDRRAEARLAAGEATIAFTIESGPRAVFGAPLWRGLDRTRPDFLEKQIPWRSGEPFDLSALDAYRDSLIATELFSAISVEPGAVDDAGVAPILVTLTERPPRTIGAGVSFSTNIGPGGQTFWEHRNLFGRAERLRLELDASQIVQTASGRYRRPFPATRAAFFTSLEVSHEDNDAFRGARGTANAGFEKRFARRWTASAAAEFEAARTFDAFEGGSFLVSLPLQARWSSADDLLDPTRGLRLSLLAAPHGGEADGAVAFTRWTAEGAAYQPVVSERVIAAGWLRLGGIVGPGTAEIPATKRYFAGGGGSLRAYGYKLVGPLNEDLEPVGGRSLLEGGVELRWRFADKFSIAGFFEGGDAFRTGAPDLGAPLRYGAGGGLRYHTPVGPLRVDVGVPLDRRAGVDDGFQLYISLGQAF